MTEVVPTSPASEPALLRAWPGLRGRLARSPFLEGITPVEPLPLEGFPPGRLLVKRDDRSCALYGGNKPRKLEFVLGDALARGARRIVTMGGIGSHHGLATTILGRQVGLETTLVLVDQPLTDEVRETLLLQAAWGAEQHFARGIAHAALQVTRSLARGRLAGERPYLLWVGGSSPRGTLGFVSAGLELAEQIRDGSAPRPAEIAVPIGSGGTFAGLVLGLRLAEMPIRVCGVLVTDLLPPSPWRLALTARRTLRLLRRLDPGVPRLAIRPADFPIEKRHVGPGYGAPTTEALEARSAAAEHGLALEATYTAKCLAALRARAARGDLPPGPLLFWNTAPAGGASPPRPPDPALLPPALRRRWSTPDRDVIGSAPCPDA